MHNHKVIVAGLRAGILPRGELAGLLADATHSADVLEFLRFGEVAAFPFVSFSCFQSCSVGRE
jgi:hypothetical protein